MARSMWRGAIQFGLVTIPVKLYLATEQGGIGFNMLHKTCLNRIQMKIWCPYHEEVIPRSETVRGYEWSKDKYVVVTDEDLESVPLKTVRAIEIEKFVDEEQAEETASRFVKQAYYLEPDEIGRKAFYLLKSVLADARKTAICKLVLRDREQLAALNPFSDTMLQHGEALAERLVRSRSLDGHSLVLEAASNDGYLLQFYHRAGIPVLGVEPAANVARVAEERGVKTLVRFFGQDVARELLGEGVAADVIHANNVLAHVADLNGFVEGLALMVKPDGVIVIETPHVQPLVEKLEFDTVYHEHLCYYSLAALEPLFARHGLKVVDVGGI